MNNRIVFFIIFFSATQLCFAAKDGYDTEIRDYKKQIKSKSNELQEIEKEIEQKRVEKEKYKTEEENIHKKLNIFKVQLNKLNKEIVKLKTQIRITKNNLDEAKRKLEAVSTEINQFRNMMCDGLVSLYKENYAIYTFFNGPWVEQLQLLSINEKIQLVTIAEKRKLYAELAREKYTRIQDELNGLYTQLDSKSKQQNEIYQEQQSVLKTTQGKRVTVEDEIKQLNKTAEEVQQLLEKLEQKKHKTLEMKEQEEIAKKDFKKKKNNLPWPIEGKVVQNFGKNKHPELATYVISNGIKLKSKPNNDVLSIDKGEIVYASNFRSYGKTIIIDHGGGIYTIYGNLGEISAQIDKKVLAQEIIGKTSSDGILYFEVRVDNIPEDPMLWLK